LLLLLLFSSASSNSYSTLLASVTDSESMSATRILLMASLSILIFSQPFVKAYKGLTYVDSSV